MSRVGAALAIIGAGGHGREVYQVIVAARRARAVAPFAGFFDDAPDESLLRTLGTTCLGPVSEAKNFDGQVYLGLGSGRLKQKLSSGLTAGPPLVHPLADVGTDVEFADGVVVFAQSTVTTNIRLGRHVHVGRGAAVGHDTVGEDWVSIMPLASISGNVHLGERAFIGTGALVRQGVRLGAGCTVGMGAVVLGDVAPDATVVGNPARVLSGA